MFSVIVPNGDPILNRVFPSKQRNVQEVLDIARNDSRIKRIILFGSSTSTKCGPYSDVDIAIDADVSFDEFLTIAHQFYVGVHSEIDVIHLNAIKSDLLKQEIYTKGVLIYDDGIDA